MLPDETLSEELVGLEFTVSGLVHLKGLVNDPMFGRMISADPTVPDQLDAQARNRGSYVGEPACR